MSPKAQIPSHRKPRNSKMNTALRAGVTGGVMGTMALTAAAAPAFAADKNAPDQTVEMPTLSTADSNARAAESLQNSAQQFQLQQAQESAASQAKEQAKENKEKAKAKAEAKRKAEAARKAREAAQQNEAPASRSADRDSLTTASAPAPQGGNAATLINFLRAQVGKSYVMGATGPSAYDCSGLTQAAYKQVGVNLPRTSQPQSTAGTPVSLDNLQPGDLLYWGGAGNAYHVGVYVGGGKFIGAQNSSTGVVERPLSYDQPTGAVRVL
ncbi:C40 family peptidase [Streptomyces sp. PU-14G]|uniref:C40 family peptidase n=1 Tax=Streptomyces sp. PU-14G TaxID=2800808 RepID=UPI0034E05685